MHVGVVGHREEAVPTNGANRSLEVHDDRVGVALVDARDQVVSLAADDQRCSD